MENNRIPKNRYNGSGTNTVRRSRPQARLTASRKR